MLADMDPGSTWHCRSCLGFALSAVPFFRDKAAVVFLGGSLPWILFSQSLLRFFAACGQPSSWFGSKLRHAQTIGVFARSGCRCHTAVCPPVCVCISGCFTT